MTELSPQHLDQVVSYLRFARLKRFQSLRELETQFQDVIGRRITKEEIYTREEVLELVHELQTLVQSDVEVELVESSHTTVLLLSQYFGQAEHWHMKLTSNIAQLENRALLNSIADFEKEQFSEKPKDTDEHRTKLAPVLDLEATELLRQEIDRLQLENALLKQKSKPEKCLGDAATPNDETVVSGLNRKIAELEQQAANADMTPEMNRLKLQISSLEEALEGKLSESKPVQNLQKILIKKNQEIKELMQKLGQTL